MQSYITTLLFVTILYCGSMPVLYPLCLLFLMAIYLYSKTIILKYSSISYEVTEEFILIAYRVLVGALVAHFVITLLLFKGSDVFTNDLEIQ